MTATRNETITAVTVRWDDQAGVEPGWYAESYAGELVAGDSQKIWFPVRVDDFGEDEADDLAEALREAFPQAEIVFPS